jgi:hypothetical protein
VTQDTCPECRGAMEEGFIPDQGFGQIFHSCWHRGVPERLKLFGSLDLGMNLERTKQIKITAWRCNDCGYLKLYAPTPAPDTSAT